MVWASEMTIVPKKIQFENSASISARHWFLENKVNNDAEINRLGTKRG
jgi:hypothetical protein